MNTSCEITPQPLFQVEKLLGHPVLLTSPQQLCSVLFEELGLPPPSAVKNQVCKQFGDDKVGLEGLDFSV